MSPNLRSADCGLRNQGGALTYVRATDSTQLVCEDVGFVVGYLCGARPEVFYVTVLVAVGAAADAENTVGVLGKMAAAGDIIKLDGAERTTPT